ncbi:MAG: histidine phosphotransferase family protein [Zavarzinia sp.]|nr:histidine phosphotransferase family protein [Zavarzinia sp.]
MADPLLLAGLLCSRLCHDLVGPVGALVNGVELLSDTDEDDEEMREQSVALLGESAEELSIRLRFFRIAFGAAAEDAVIGREEFATTLTAMFKGRRIVAGVSGGPDEMSRAMARLAFLLAMVGADCLPRGGRLDVILGPDCGCRVVASGPRCGLPEGHAAQIAGADEVPEPRTAPSALAVTLATGAGRRVVVETGEESVSLVLV